uniref:Calcium/calmodulin dependent protein kinase II inhibitor 1 n=83 Tax=Passeriformes TaxID=9126 RepID=A0A674G9Z7_TAEGU
MLRDTPGMLRGSSGPRRVSARQLWDLRGCSGAAPCSAGSRGGRPGLLEDAPRSPGTLRGRRRGSPGDPRGCGLSPRGGAAAGAGGRAGPAPPRPVPPPAPLSPPPPEPPPQPRSREQRRPRRDVTGRPPRARCAAAPGPRAPRPGRLSGGGGGGGSPPAAPMSEGPPYGEGQLAGDAAVGQLPFPVRLRGGDGLLAGGQGKRPPKLGQIGRSKRVVIEDDRIDDVLQNLSEKAPPGV